MADNCRRESEGQVGTAGVYASKRRVVSQFVRVHKTLRVSPAMAAEIETRRWSMEDVVRLIEAREDLRSGALIIG